MAVSSPACRKAERSPGFAGVAAYGGSLQQVLKASPLSPPPEREAADASVAEPKPVSDNRSDTAPLAGRKLIRNGEVSIEVRDFESAARQASAIAAMYGGYVSDSQAAGEGTRRHGMITVRVRAAAFEQALGALKALGKVQTEHVGTQDITKAYMDLEARLRVKQDAADRLRDILKNRTARLADVLAAEKELTALVEKIESMEGERRYYDQQVSLSTISAELHEPEAVTRPSAFDPLRQAIRDSVYNLSSSLATFVTGMLYVLPWALVIAALILIVRRLRARRLR